MKTSICLLTILAIAGLLENELVVGQETATDTSTETADTSKVVPDEQPESSTTAEEEIAEDEPVQSGPFIDLFGTQLYSMEMIDETSAQLYANYTNHALAGKKVVGLYFSADWCGPCRQFTPELVSFYNRMNSRRGKKDQFEIVWISRCRDVDSYVQYFAQMPWVALPPDEAMGERGQALGEKYKIKGIPGLVLLDDLGQVIVLDARNKLPTDKAGIGFP
jgi:nucleoredoxin